MDALKIISEGSIKAEKPQFNVGDTVRVDVRIKEGDRERIQAFEGTVIAKKHGGVAETFTVRRVAYGVGIERVFPINSPFVEKVTVVRKGKVRRAKLFYLRWSYGQGCQGQERYLIIPDLKREKRDNLVVPFFFIKISEKCGFLQAPFLRRACRLRYNRVSSVKPEGEVYRIWKNRNRQSPCVGRTCWNGTRH